MNKYHKVEIVKYEILRRDKSKPYSFFHPYPVAIRATFSDGHYMIRGGYTVKLAYKRLCGSARLAIGIDWHRDREEFLNHPINKML